MLTGRPLVRLRSSIDNIDAALLHLLAERFKCTQAVGELKAARGMPPADPEREVAQVLGHPALRGGGVVGDVLVRGRQPGPGPSCVAHPPSLSRREPVRDRAPA